MGHDQITIKYYLIIKLEIVHLNKQTQLDPLIMSRVKLKEKLLYNILQKYYMEMKEQ